MYLKVLWIILHKFKNIYTLQKKYVSTTFPPNNCIVLLLQIQDAEEEILTPIYGDHS